MSNVNRSIFFPVMWPLGTTAPAARPAPAAWTLMGVHLALLAALFVWPAAIMEHCTLPSGGRAYQFLTYALAPASLAGGLLSVMMLWTYGPALESRIGPWRLLLIYFVSAVAGGAAHHFLPLGEPAPLAGAAPAVCGLIGATLVFFPKAMVRFFMGVYFLLSPIFARVVLIHVAAFAMLYAIAELLLLQLEQTTELPFVLGHSAFSIGAHLGGLATGAALAALFSRRPAASPEHEIPRRIRDEKELLKPTAVIHEPLGPYKKNTGQPGLASAPATIDQVDPDMAALEALDLTSSPPASSFEQLFTQRLLFADDEEDAFAAAPPLGEPHPVKKPAPDLFATEGEQDVISFDPTDDSRRGSACESRDLNAAEASHPPLVIPMLEAAPSHADEAAQSERHDRPTVRRPYAFDEPPPYEQATRKLAATPEEAPERFEIQMETSEDTQNQARALRDKTAWPDLKSGRFAVILAPGRPQNLTPIVEVMARAMGLSPKAAYGKLVRRRGILADNLGCEEAEHVAAEFARAGHPVLVAALTGRTEFGEGLDLIAVQDQGEHVRFATVAQVVPAGWSQVVFLAAGEVSIRPGLPGHTVLDIFLVQPRHHLRLWDNTFSYTRETPRFRPLVELFTRKASGAIHTSSLDKWLKGEKYTLHHFSSMIEYDHYLRWHLLAHLAPTRQFK